jgi:hypothetical protein
MTLPLASHDGLIVWPSAAAVEWAVGCPDQALGYLTPAEYLASVGVDV